MSALGLLGFLTLFFCLLFEGTLLGFFVLNLIFVLVSVQVCS